MLHSQRVRARQRGLVRGLRGNACRRVETERGPDRPLGHVLGAPPLAGIRAVEIGNYMAGPFCGMQLADLGADVVKVEHPKAGDLARLLEPLASGESGNFARLNRDKRSLAIDLKREEGREVFKRLAGRADVIVENLRPGTMDDLGLSPASLLQANARLVYVAVTGWGLDGPYADRPALDIIVQGQSGLMSITGEEGGVPVKVGVSIADLTAALYATIATLAALRARERDGRGQLVDISMFESAVSLAVWEAGVYFGSGEVPRAAGSAHKLVAPYQAVAVPAWVSTAPRCSVSLAWATPTWTISRAQASSLAHDRGDPDRAPCRRALDRRRPTGCAQRDDVRDVRPHRRDLPRRERRRLDQGRGDQRFGRCVRGRNGHRPVRRFQGGVAGARVRAPYGRVARCYRGRPRAHDRGTSRTGRRRWARDRGGVRPPRRRAVGALRSPGRENARELLLRREHRPPRRARRSRSREGACLHGAAHRRAGGTSDRSRHRDRGR